MFDLGYEVFVVPVLWAALLITTAFLVLTSFKREKVEGDEYATKRVANTSRLKRAGALFVVGGLLLASLVVVPPGHRGAIYTTTGVDLNERDEGYSLILPVVHNANMVNVREQKYENLEVYAQTFDGLEVTTQVGVNYLIVPDMAADIFRDVGQAYEATIIEPAVLGLVKREIGLVIAENLFFQRGEVEEAIFNSLNSRLNSVGINVTFVALQDTIFDPSIVDEFLAKEAARQRQVTSEREVTVANNEREAQRHRDDATAYGILVAGEAQIEVAEGLAAALTNDVVQFELAKQGIRYLPNTLVGDAVDILLGVDTEVE